MTKCNKIDVPRDCCRIRFGEGKYSYSDEGDRTVRGEHMIIDRDKNGYVIGIELLGGIRCKKPCQETTHRGK